MSYVHVLLPKRSMCFLLVRSCVQSHRCEIEKNIIYHTLIVASDKVDIHGIAS